MMSEWQPIETAPKDQSIIVVDSSGDVGLACFWKDKDPNCEEGAGKWVTDWPVCDFKYATHWMPIPKPPIKKHYCKKGMMEVNGSLLGIHDDNWGPAYVLVKYCPICGEKGDE